MKYSELDINKLNDNQIYDLVMSGVKDYAKIPVDEESRPDLLIVLGATPIPMKARIIKAMQLYKNGYGKYIVLSGGKGWHKLFKTEDRSFKDELERYTYYSGKRRKYKLMKRALQRTIPQELRNKNKQGKALYRHMHRAIENNLNQSEADIGLKIIKACSEIGRIDPDKIFLENNSSNTRENIVNSMKIMQEKLKEQGKETNKEKEEIKSVMIITSCFHCKRTELTFKKFFPDVEVQACPSTKDLYDNGITLDKESLMSNAYYRQEIRNELRGIVEYSRNGSIADEEIVEKGIEKEQEI